MPCHQNEDITLASPYLFRIAIAMSIGSIVLFARLATTVPLPHFLIPVSFTLIRSHPLSSARPACSLGGLCFRPKFFVLSRLLARPVALPWSRDTTGERTYCPPLVHSEPPAANGTELPSPLAKLERGGWWWMVDRPTVLCCYVVQ